MKPQVKQSPKREAVKAEHRSLDEYQVRSFAQKIREESRSRSLMVAELNELTEGKSIILSNAK